MFFSHFWAYVGQPHDHIGWAQSMPFASINPTNLRTSLWNFHKKNWELTELKNDLFLSRPFWIFFFKKKKNFFWKKNFKMADSKKVSFSTTPKSWAITAKISWIGPWVSRIDWCEGHWCDITYMIERRSNVSSKTGKKCIFCVFRPFLSLSQTASLP